MARSSGWINRFGGAAGIAFVALFMASFEFGADGFSGPDQTAAAIARDLAQNRLDGLGMSVALLGLAAVAGYWFVASLHRRLTAHGSSTAAWAALVGGVALITVILVGSGVKEAAATVDSLAADPQVAKTLWLLEQGFFTALIGPPLIAFTLGVSVVAIRHGDPPRWLGWTGVVFAAGLALNIGLGLGSLAVAGFVWVLMLALTVTVRSQPSVG